MESTTITAANAASDASRSARVSAIANAPKGTKAPTAKRPAPKKVVAPSGPTAPTAAEKAKARAARPVTGTIAAYVDFLEKNRIFGAKPLTAREREIAGKSITLYGAYQSSPERKDARGY